MSIREQILSAKDLHSEILEVPEWGVSVKIKSISQGARARLIKDCGDGNGGIDAEKFTPALLIATLYDPLNDQPVFTPGDRDALNEKGVRAIEAVLKVSMRVSGFSGADGLEKNSEGTESAESLSV